MLTVMELDTEFGYDILKVYNGIEGDEGKQAILSTMSGSSPQQSIISSQEGMRVTFSSDGSNNGKGFKAVVSAFNKQGEEFTHCSLDRLVDR